MIDRESRNRYAAQLRHFAAGVLSVDDYEDRTDDLVLGNADEALYKVWRNVWTLYDDFRTERLRGDWELTKETRRWIAVSILLLHSDCEYDWPEFRSDAKTRLFRFIDDLVDPLLFLTDLFTLKAFRLQERWRTLTEPVRERQWEARQAFMRQFGDMNMDIWPFLYQADYEAALKNHKFLAGANP